MTDFKRALENRASSSYIAEYSAPKIELADLDKLQQVRHLNLNKKIETRLQEIKAEYDALVSLHEWNSFVDSFECRIECIIGQDYYLYEAEEGRRFLSIIEPERFTMKYKFHGKTRLNSFGFFEKVDIDKIDNS
jgi:hypothetical protein